MWSEDRNCDVSADLPTPDAPSMATLYCSGGGPRATSTAGSMAHAPCCAALCAGGANDDLRDARDARRDEPPEQLLKSSPELVRELE